MKRIYYLNDFVLKIMPKDLLGNDVEIPQGDFDIIFESGNRTYVCSKRGDEYKRCRMQDGALVCVFDNHGLSADVLFISAIFFTPNAAYPDGTQAEKIEKHALDVELVTTDENDISEYSTEIVLPFAVITAYQMAVNAGYAGTEAEWLEMMKGANKIDIRQSEGNSTTAVMSQKATTESLGKRDKAILDLQSQITAINAEKATFTVKRTSGSNIYFCSTAMDYYIQADCSIVADTIVISQGGATKNSVTGNKQCVFHESKTATAVTSPTTLTYTATATLGSITKTASVSVYVVNPVYIGAASTYTAVIADTYRQSARTSVAGTYNVTVNTSGDYVFFVVPSQMTINKVTLSGFDFPLNAADTSSKTGYKIYKSANTYKAGTMTLVVS